MNYTDFESHVLGTGNSSPLNKLFDVNVKSSTAFLQNSKQDFWVLVYRHVRFKRF